MTNLNEWFASTIKESPVRKALICNDGTSLSVQASNFHYCFPRVDNSPFYATVEVWQVTSEVPDSWLEYGDPERILLLTSQGHLLKNLLIVTEELNATVNH